VLMSALDQGPDSDIGLLSVTSGTSDPFLNAPIHAVIMVFVGVSQRSPGPRRRQCDDAIS
jgi:hypothetical protein